MRLHNDISRCADADCPKAEQCARYVQRIVTIGDGVGWVVMTPSLREGEEECKSFIQETTNEEERWTR